MLCSFVFSDLRGKKVNDKCDKKWTETDGMPGYSRQTKPPRDQPSKETKETWQLQKTEPSQDSKLNFSKGARFKLTQMLKQ
jgi:hypothetical protein